MNAQLVNAVNLPAMNAINFPAAVLQPPYFDRSSRCPWITAPSAHDRRGSATVSMTRRLFDAQGRLAGGSVIRALSPQARGSPLGWYKPFPDLSSRAQTRAKTSRRPRRPERRL